MDQFDQAQDIETREREALLRDHAIMSANAGISATECVTCGADIPAARREAVQGVERCIRCAAGRERF